MSKTAFALVDCNNFYASCERVFNPSLHGKPLAILSNNDGCIIARSEEAKRAGVEMGVPAFKIRNLVKEKDIILRSSNYALYGDMSRRVMETLRNLSEVVEPYSIDEAFISFPQLEKDDLTAFGHTLRKTLKQWTGIPVSVGIAPSKTLAKIANETAKNHPQYEGVLNFIDNEHLDNILSEMALTDIWGIGAGLSQRLLRAGVTTAYQLKKTIKNRKWVRKKLSVKGLRTVIELNGKPCLDIEQRRDSRKGIMTSRSFGHTLTQLEDLEEAISEYASVAAEKLRAQESVTSLMHITLRTSKYAGRRARSKYKHSMECVFNAPTADTSQIIRYARACVKSLYDDNKRYKKATVKLSGLLPQNEVQSHLFEDQQYTPQKHRLMNKMDQINARYGSQSAHFASTGLKQSWRMNQQHLSPRYTTRWDDLMKVRSG